MNAVKSESEIAKVISRATGAKTKDFEVRALRPACGNKQNATIVMNDQDANKPIQTGKLKIGWTQCMVLERKRDPRYYRCWEHGHIKAQCKGPDREGLCIKCVKDGDTLRVSARMLPSALFATKWEIKHIAENAKTYVGLIMRILQINTNRSRQAHDIALATAMKLNVDIIIMSEPNVAAAHDGMNWVCDEEYTSVIKILTKNIRVGKQGHGKGFSYIATTQLTLFIN